MLILIVLFMGSFKSGRKGGFRPGGSRFGRSERSSRSRDSDQGERRPLQMHEITCDKCGKQSEVPFRPKGDKPVYCSDCFKKPEGSRENAGSRDRSSSGMSSEQFNKLNGKLDRIIKALELDSEDDE